jgi:hypothetical protein
VAVPIVVMDVVRIFSGNQEPGLALVGPSWNHADHDRENRVLRPPVSVTAEPGLLGSQTTLFEHALRLHQHVPDGALPRDGEPHPDDERHRQRPARSAKDRVRTQVSRSPDSTTDVGDLTGPMPEHARRRSRRMTLCNYVDRPRTSAQRWCLTMVHWIRQNGCEAGTAPTRGA